MEIPESYTQEQQQLGDDQRFAYALGVPLPDVERLRLEVLGDLHESIKGVGWWRDHLDRQRRILISDHLFVCCGSVIQNTVEAALHLREYVMWRERFDGLHAGMARVRARISPFDTRAPIEFRYPPKSPASDLIRESCTVHSAGLFRAIASALDCLAAVIVGVEALPVGILRADFQGLRARLGQLSADQRVRRIRDWLAPLKSLSKGKGAAAPGIRRSGDARGSAGCA